MLKLTGETVKRILVVGFYRDGNRVCVAEKSGQVRSVWFSDDGTIVPVMLLGRLLTARVNLPE